MNAVHKLKLHALSTYAYMALRPLFATEFLS